MAGEITLEVDAIFKVSAAEVRLIVHLADRRVKATPVSHEINTVCVVSRGFRNNTDKRRDKQQLRGNSP